MSGAEKVSIAYLNENTAIVSRPEVTCSLCGRYPRIPGVHGGPHSHSLGLPSGRYEQFVQAVRDGRAARREIETEETA